jgi:hypothetical protein
MPGTAECQASADDTRPCDQNPQAVSFVDVEPTGEIFCIVSMFMSIITPGWPSDKADPQLR